MFAPYIIYCSLLLGSFWICFLPGGGLADLVADAELEKAGDLASDYSVKISYVAFLRFSLLFTQECSMHVLVDEPRMLNTQSILNHRGAFTQPSTSAILWEDVESESHSARVIVTVK